MIKIGVISAMQSESSCLKGNVRNSKLSIEVSGIGAEAARKCTESLCQRKCSGIISFGYIGALNPLYKTGTIIVGNSVSDGNETINLKTKWFYHLQKTIFSENISRVEYSKILTVPSLLGSKKQKEALNYKENWDAVDMESFTIAKTAATYDIPVLIVRAILDELNTTIPQGSAKMISSDGRPLLLSMFRELTKNPTDIFDYLKLAKARSKANSALYRIAPIIGQHIAIGRAAI